MGGFRNRCAVGSTSGWCVLATCAGVVGGVGGSEALATVRYVDDTAAGLNNGSNWTNAFTSLQSALAVAVSGDEVRVGQGTYRPAGVNGNRSTSFVLISGVTWRGGYAGVGAKDPDARDVDVYETILSGDLNGNDGANFANYGENSYHVVYAADASNTSIVDGFTIRGGNADGSGINSDGGGVLHSFVGQPGSAMFRDCQLINNSAQDGGGAGGMVGNATFESCRFEANRCTNSSGGGFLQHGGGAVTLTDCVFQGNTAAIRGAGMESREGATATVTGCTFDGNFTIGSGGAAYVDQSSVAFVGCLFYQNSVNGNGGAIEVPASGSVSCTDCAFIDNAAGSGSSDGGAIRWGSPTGTLTLSNCDFEANYSGSRGGAVSCTTSSGPVHVDDCTFTDNQAQHGGAMNFVNAGSGSSLTDCDFDVNSAFSLGGAMIITGTSPTLSNCHFTGNWCTDGGGAIFAQSGSSPTLWNCDFTGNSVTPTGGGACYFSGGSPKIVMCDFVGNSAASAGGATYNSDGVSATYVNCRFCDNNAVGGTGNGGAMHIAVSSPLVVGCLFSGNTAVGRGGAIQNNSGANGNFTNCTFSSNAAGTNGGAMHIESSSPNIRNCAFWRNTDNGSSNVFDEQFYIASGSPLYSSNSIQGFIGSGSNGNLNCDPLFRDADGADNTLGTLDDDVRLTKRSLCIDLADDGALPVDTYDIDGDANTSEPLPLDVYGNARVVDCVDIGAAEYDGVDPTLLAIGCDGATSGACFSGIGDLPEGNFESIALAVSENGLVVAGRSKVGTPQAGSYEATVRTVSGLAGLGKFAAPGALSEAQAISGDGRTVVGDSNVSGGTVAFRWTDCEGLVNLGDLPGGALSGFAFGASFDGSVIVGYGATAATSNEAFRWTQAGGMIGLGDLPGGAISSVAHDVSSDGSVVAGYSHAALGAEAFRWTQAGGMVSLGQLAGGSHNSFALAVNADGSVVVGASNSGNGNEAFRWTESDGTMVGLGDLPGGAFNSTAYDLSGDGAVIVGFGEVESGATPFYWTECIGMMDLQQMLVDEFGLGAELAGWDLQVALGVSADGLTIVGYGTNPSNQTEGWIAHIPYIPGPSCPADVAPTGGDGVVGIADLLAVIGAWGVCSGPPTLCDADTNCDGVVGIADLLMVIGAWGACVVEEQTGACCMPNGSCVNDQTNAECTKAGGVFEGVGTDCTTANCVQPPANDDWSDSETISGSDVTVNWDNALATTDGPASACGGDATRDVWFNYTAGCNGILEVHTLGTQSRFNDTILELYEGVTPGGALAGCNNNVNGCSGLSQILVPVTSGDEFTIRCASNGNSATNEGPGMLSIRCVGPDNDLCVNAKTMALGTTANYTVASGATPDGAPICSGVGADEPGYWYRVVGDGSTLTAHTCNSELAGETAILIYEGTCGALSCVAGIDADNLGGLGSCGNSFHETVSWASECGKEYWILATDETGFEQAMVLYVGP